MKNKSDYKDFEPVRNECLVPHFLIGDLVPGVEHEEEHHLVGVDTQDVLLGLDTLTLAGIIFFFLLFTEEQGIKVRRPGAGLQGQDPATVLAQVKVLEDSKSLN